MRDINIPATTFGRNLQLFLSLDHLSRDVFHAGSSQIERAIPDQILIQLLLAHLIQDLIHCRGSALFLVRLQVAKRQGLVSTVHG